MCLCGKLLQNLISFYVFNKPNGARPYLELGMKIRDMPYLLEHVSCRLSTGCLCILKFRRQKKVNHLKN